MIGTVKPKKMQVYFYARNYPSGYCVIAYQIVFAGTKSRQKSTRIRCKTEDWNVKRLEIENDEVSSECLTRFRQMLYEFYWGRKDLFETAQQIQDAFEDVEPAKKRLVEVFEAFIDEQEELCHAKQISRRTVQTYNDKLNQIKAFLQKKRLSGMTLAEVKMGMVRDLVHFLKTKDNPQAHNQAMRTVALLKRILEISVDKGFLEKNSLAQFSERRQKPKQGKALSEPDLYKIETMILPNERLAAVRDWFVFMSYCLFTWADFEDFDFERDTYSMDNVIWIDKGRAKNDEKTAALLPMFPKAWEIWKKYKGIKLKMLLKDFNICLKQIAMLAGLPDYQKVTSYTARHTGSNWLRNQYGITSDTLSRMMGNSKAVVESYYTHVQRRKVWAEVKFVYGQ